MKIYRTYKFKMYPNEEQKRKINMFIGSSRFVYNYYLDKKDMYYKEGINLSLSDMKKDLVFLKEDKTWLKEIDSIPLTTALDNLDRAYKNYFNNRSNHPVF